MSGVSSQSILSRAISVYSIPPELLSNLTVRSIQQDAQDPLDAAPSRSEVDGLSKPTVSGVFSGAAAAGSGAGGTLRCQTCPNAGFETVEEQREHFKSDWHRYNAKAKLTGRIVTAEEWDNMVEGVSSISGSASSSSGSSQSKITRLLQKQSLTRDAEATDAVDSDEEAELADRRRRAHLRTAVIWFTPISPLESLGVPRDTQFGVHRALFPPLETAQDYLVELKRLQLSAQPTRVVDDTEEERRITMLMVAGGHFAGMVVALRPRDKRERQEVKGAGEIRVLKHKTFHRYTTRRKQGGSQGLNDNAKSKAVSAGAMLRRYGEQALQEEIRALLSDWAEDLAASERIFIRASTHGKRSFWGYDGAVLDKLDDRIRTFPFPTRRPTLQELLRCWHELTRVKTSRLSAEALQALDDAYIASLQPRKAPPKPVAAPVPVAPVPAPRDPEEEARQDRQRRLVEMVRKGRLDALRPFWTKYAAEFDATVLGTAASAGQEEVIRYFLEEVRLNPTIPLEGGKRAYDLASTKGARNVFRRIRHEHGEWYDWAAAHVPVGLSEEAEAKQDEKKAERRKGLREKMKEREKARAEAEAEADAAAEEDEARQRTAEEEARKKQGAGGFGQLGLPQSSGPQKLGGRGAEGLAGMSAEMRMQIERERRARAAEARFR